MRWIFLAILSLVLSFTSMAQMPDPLCVLDPAKMPASWRPPSELQKTLNPAPWSESEAKDAEYAIKTGIDEIISFLKQKPSALQSVWADAIEALMQVTYSSANDPAFDVKVREAARDLLAKLITYHFSHKPDPQTVSCDDFERTLPLTIFAHTLYPANDPRTAEITKRTNAAYRVCGSLKVATGHDYKEILAAERVRPKRLLELYIWALWFIEAELYSDIELPVETRAYGPALWNYLKTYRLPGASEFEDGPWDDKFVAIADLAPHIAHVPTGTNRYPLYVEYKPDLYRFHRENFYAVMQLNELDLFASIVDTLRQYGCTPENDVQVRDGTRYLLKLFHDGNDKWMDFRQDGETDIDDYGLVHYPWTGVLGIRPRKLEEPRPRNIGGIVRRWLPHPPD